MMTKMYNNEKGGAECMEKIEVVETKIKYKDLCPICKKEIIGTSESQVSSNMKVHIITQHSEISDAKQ